MLDVSAKYILSYHQSGFRESKYLPAVHWRGGKKGATTGNRASKPARLQDRPGNAGKLEVRRIRHNYPAGHCIADYTPLVLSIPLPSSWILLTALLVGWNQTAVIDVDLSSVFHCEASQSLTVRPAAVRTMLYHSIG